MNILGVVIGLARERVKEVGRALSLASASAAQAPLPRGRHPPPLHPAPSAGHEDQKEQAVEDGYNAAWMRRKARDEAEVEDRFGEVALRQARVERREAQRLVADAAEQVQAVLRRKAGERSK
jgi:hypothetical protein